MTTHDINRIPIVDAGRVIGIITRADLLRTLTRRNAAVTEDARWRILHDLWIDTTLPPFVRRADGGLAGGC